MIVRTTQATSTRGWFRAEPSTLTEEFTSSVTAQPNPVNVGDIELNVTTTTISGSDDFGLTGSSPRMHDHVGRTS